MRRSTQIAFSTHPFAPIGLCVRLSRTQWLYLILSGLARFAVEFWRINPALAPGLTEARWFSLALVALGVSLLIVRPAVTAASAEA